MAGADEQPDADGVGTSGRVLVFTEANAMRNFSRQQRAAGRSIALVPTMGYLHEGHLSLIEAARRRADTVVASIYVNPTQFSKNEDFSQYPRNTAADHEQLRHAGCDAVFEPSTLYSAGGPAGDAGVVVGVSEHEAGAHETFVQVEHLQRGLCGASRPHFFRGVATVVAKLFNIVEPDMAFFGRKDYQQWRVLSTMARDLDFDVDVVGMPIVRHADGLAMSSRNALMTSEDRERAPGIYRALQWAHDAAAAGDAVTADDLQNGVRRRIAESGGRVDYVEVVHAHTLEPVKDITRQLTLIAVAVHFGAVRLIDNMVLGEEDAGGGL